MKNKALQIVLLFGTIFGLTLLNIGFIQLSKNMIEKTKRNKTSQSTIISNSGIQKENRNSIISSESEKVQSINDIIENQTEESKYLYFY